MSGRCWTRLGAAIAALLVGLGSVEAGRPTADAECVYPKDFYAAPQVADVFDFGPVRVWGAQEGENSYPLAITDCHKEPGLELLIRLSPEESDPPVRFSFRSVCGPGQQPPRVMFQFSQGSEQALWRATRVDGSLLDQVATGPSPDLQTVSLSHPEGIFFVEVTGAEICVESICWQCDDPNPDDRPCADPNDQFREPGRFDTVELGFVKVSAAELPNGDVVPLGIEDCDNDGELELSIPWSEASANKPAQIHLENVDCANETLYPTTVIISVAICGFDTTFRAFDFGGNFLTSASVPNGATNVDVVLQHASGIFRVDVAGAELCIDRICWRCDELPPPAEEPCADPAEVFDQRLEADQIEIGLVDVKAATLPSGEVVPLQITDCDGDGDLELSVPWSEAGAAPPAQISLERVDCANDTLYPTSVTISVGFCGFDTWFRAYDAFNNYLTTGFVPNGATNVDVVLQHPSGIFRIEIIGAELCIDRICWDCEPLDPNETGPGFRRADSNGDGDVALVDVVFTLNFLFLGGPRPGCADAADADDDGDLALNDAVFSLNYLFLGGPAPLGSDGCHPDPTEDDLGCASPGSCAR